MAIMFRTPDILGDITRMTHFDETVFRLEEAVEVQTAEAVLVRELDKMVADGIPLSQTQLAKRAGATGSTLKRYDYIFKDVIDMLSLFFPVSKRAPKETNPELKAIAEELQKNNITGFESLERETSMKMRSFIDGIYGEYALLVSGLYEKGLVNETFYKKSMEPSEAQFSFTGQRFIHPDFVNLDINQMGEFVYGKYQKVQELQKEYDRLKAELR